MIKVYVGDINEMDLIRSTEEGDENYRLVTGITDMSYTVKNLAEAGTFYFKVRATYIDGTQSRWSKAKTVILEGEGYAVGDVNRDGYVTSADVTCIYNYLLNGDETFLDTCDVNGDGYITSADVTVIYNILLGN